MTRERKLFENEAKNAARSDRQQTERSKAGPVGVPHSGTETSRQAAERITPAASAQAARVLVYIAQRGDAGATDHELQAALGMTGDSERPRRWSLQRAGLIRDSGQRRKSPAGRAAIVWVATDAALPAAVASPKPSQVS